MIARPRNGITNARPIILRPRAGCPVMIATMPTTQAIGQHNTQIAMSPPVN